MKILGIDTSSKKLSIAVSNDKEIFKEESFFLDRKHSSQLVPKIKEVLGSIDLSIRDIDVFIVGLGPGSFTGLRIGISTIKGFGIATQKPCIGISSIDGLAEGVDQETRLIVPVIDAKRGNLYSALYRKEKNNIVRKSNYFLLKPAEIMKKVKKAAVFLGDGISIYRDKIQDLNKSAIFLGEEYWYPRAGNIIKRALREKRIKKIGLDKLDPIYLYPKDCQVRKS